MIDKTPACVPDAVGVNDTSIVLPASSLAGQLLAQDLLRLLAGAA